MPLLDITKPETINFLKESYERTAELRIRWINKHATEMKRAATIDKDKEKGYNEEDVLKANYSANMPAVTRDFISSGRNRRRKVDENINLVPGIKALKKGHTILEMGLGDANVDPRLARPDTDLTIDPIMKPVKIKEKEILYKGKPDYGRLEYLKCRHRTKPEDNFYFEECSSWDYGWRQKYSYFRAHAPQCPRVWRLTRGMMSRSGPHPDPVHYNPILNKGPLSKCLM